MNDGIYYPFDDERFREYQEGFRKLIAACEKAGAKVVLMTPAPFDPQPVKDKVLAKGAEKYSWLKPYAGYDDVLKLYSDWLLSFRDRGYLVADAHSAMRGDHLARMRKIDPAYAISADGVHPDANGHYIIFRELATTLGLPMDGVEAHLDAAAGTSGSPGVSGVKVGLASWSSIGKRPRVFHAIRPRTIAWPTWKPWPAAWAGLGWPSRDFQPASTLFTRAIRLDRRRDSR